MKFTEEENAQRKSIMAGAMSAAASHAATLGIELTTEQTAQVMERLGAILADLHAHEETAALDLLTAASTLQVIGEVLGIIPTPSSTPDPDPLALGLELAHVAGVATANLLKSGGYPEPTAIQRGQLVTAARKLAHPLIRDAVPFDEACAAIQEFMGVAVLVVMGPAPARAHFN
ncbi:hypothetical protein [Pyxidicoccus xibeiensis]|uniref:hypothetical protein n=1 Tax=Pyxidicoccus xibeiensis TaxID=2906759 RepID=UPI0020A7C278|nr:hypothetical protein [Pyxidicoccus xibeiensis]MCP3137538.1 hypothetical protein [Pyxidicoccus xibeiensis]